MSIYSLLAEEERVLKKLLVLHPLNVGLWVLLGKLYMRLSLSTPGSVSNGCNSMKTLHTVGDPDVESSNFKLTSDDCISERVDCSVSESQIASVADDCCLSRISCTSDCLKELKIQSTHETCTLKTSLCPPSHAERQLEFENVRLELIKALICLETARYANNFCSYLFVICKALL